MSYRITRTGHEDDIILFSGLNSNQRDWKVTPGYLFKEYWNEKY
jgi:hypothetical protein